MTFCGPARKEWFARRRGDAEEKEECTREGAKVFARVSALFAWEWVKRLWRD